MFNGNTYYFYGHFQWRFVCLPGTYHIICNKNVAQCQWWSQGDRGISVVISCSELNRSFFLYTHKVTHAHINLYIWLITYYIYILCTIYIFVYILYIYIYMHVHDIHCQLWTFSLRQDKAQLKIHVTWRLDALRRWSAIPSFIRVCAPNDPWHGPCFASTHCLLTGA